MARKKKKKQKSDGGFLAAIGLGSGKKPRKKRKTKAEKQAAREKTVYRVKMGVAMVLGLAVFAGIAVGFFFLDRYVKTESPVKAAAGPIELLNPPEWFKATPALQTEITRKLGGSSFKLDANTAEAIGSTLRTFPYLYNVGTLMTSSSVRVAADFRRPIAKIEVQGRSFYVGWKDENSSAGRESLIVLPYVAMTEIYTPEIKGFSAASVPRTGKVWQGPDAIAAVRIIELLRAMDRKLCPQKPLLDEITTVDVSNYAGHRDAPKIVLYAKDGTAVNWGASVGEGPRNFEPEYTEKLTALYQLYKPNMTLQGRTRFIDLRYR